MYHRVTALFLFLIVAQQLSAQSRGGTLIGTVSGPSGENIAAANVTAQNDATSVTQSFQSSPHGRFAFVNLEPGTYTVSVKCRGYAEATRNRVVVRPQGQTVVEMRLAPSSPNEAPSESGSSKTHPLSSGPTFSDAPQLRASGFQDSVDAGGYSAEARAQTSMHLLQGVDDLKQGSSPPVSPPEDAAGAGSNRAFLQAEVNLQRAVALQPESFEANYQLGELYLSVGQIAAGIPYLEKAQRLTPSHYASGYDLALAYLETQDHAKARAQIQKMLRRQDHAELHNLLGEIEQSAGNHVAAAHEFQRAAQMDPNEKNIFDWGNCLLLHRAYEPAVEIFSRGVAYHPNSSKLHIGAGVALYSRGQYDEAVESLIRATDLEPSDPRPYLFLGRMFDISLRKAEEVAQRLQRFAELQPGNAQANYYHAMALWKGRRAQSGETLDRVEALLRTSAALDPRFPDPHLQLGNLYFSQQKLSAAIQAYEQAVKIQPELAEAHYRLAQALARVGERARAQEELSLHDRLRKQQQAEEERKQKQTGRLEYSMEEAAKP